MREALRGIAVLLLLTALAGAGIAWFAERTESAIDANRAAAESGALRELAGFALQPNAGDVLLCSEQLLILRGRGRGYGSPIKLAVALGADGSVSGVRVLDHAETPGFADILAADSMWLAGFRQGEADAVTGATVTSTAVLRAVAEVVQRYRREGQSLCGFTPRPAPGAAVR